MPLYERALGKVENDDLADWREAWALFPGDVAYVWHAALHASEVEASLLAAELQIRTQIVWDKTRLVLGRGDYHWQHELCWLSFAPPTCRMPLGQASGFSRADPRGRGTPRFRHRLIRLSTLHRRFACARLSQPCLPGSGPDVSATLTTIALDDTSLRWLETCT